MQTKLTLRLEEHLIAEAKAYARKEGKSLSQMITEYFTALSSKSAVSSEKKLRPVTKKLFGCMENVGLDEGDYKSYLAEKYR